MHPLFQKISNKKALIGVIGLGYVGLPLVKAFCRSGFSVTGFDIDKNKIEMLQRGQSYIKHFDFSQIDPKKFHPTTDFSHIQKLDAIIICVPTPLTRNREPELKYIVSTVKTISKHLRKGQIIVLESTTYPGTTDEVVVPLLNQNPFKMKAGKDFFVAFSPEREDPGNTKYHLGAIPKVVGGINEESTKLACKLYGLIVKKTVPVSSTKVAEASKILENIYRSVNIALVNELKTLFEKMDIDIWEVIAASSTKPFGFHAFYPGPGLGGHCIPIDPFYLTWKAKEYGQNVRFIELAGEINTSMPLHVCHRTMEALNDSGKSVKNARILILGVAYKKNIDDLRESPSLEIIEILEKMGAHVDYFDPYITKIVSSRRPHIKQRSLEEEEASQKEFDAALILTAHDCFDYARLLKKIPLVIDTRNALQDKTLKSTKIIRA